MNELPTRNMTATEISCTSAKESHRRIVPRSDIDRVSSCPDDQRSIIDRGARSNLSKKFMRIRISIVEVGSTISHLRQ